MEVILTLSNRITLAGAIPILVAIAVAAIVVAITLAPNRSALAVDDAKGCDLSPVILDMLLDRYGLESHDCDNLDLQDVDGTAGADNETLNTDDGHTVNTWDFSGKGLTEFAITKEDADILKVLTDNDTTDTTETSVVEAAVRYIDLTGNPLSIEDVSAANIPARVAVRISSDSTVTGFQSSEYTVTEGKSTFITVAFPNLRSDDDLGFSAFVSVDGDAREDVNRGIAAANTLKRTLISFGDQDAGRANDTRELPLNSESETIVFAWPVMVQKDNDNSDSWIVDLEIPETTAGLTNSVDDFGLAIQRSELVVMDADAPTPSVCDRSEDVQRTIEETADRAATANTTDSTGAFLIYGGHDDCSELTLTDLGRMTVAVADDAQADTTDSAAVAAQTGVFWVEDSFGDGEPLESLIAGDFAGLTGVQRLHIIGARSLPSGIFAGVGSADGNTVEITFDKNTSGEEDVDNVGNITPSTMPAHIWADQEKQQIITIADDTNDKNMGTTGGLDATQYAGTEEGHFFVLTNAATSAYVLDTDLDFASAELAGPSADATEANRLVRNAGGGKDSETSRVSRFAVTITADDDKDDEDRWLFLFANGVTLSGLNVTNVVDMAVVSVTDND